MNPKKTSHSDMSTLLEIGQDMAALDELMDEIGGDITDPQVETYLDQWFSELHKNETEKLDSYAALINEKEELAKVRKAQATRLAEKARRDQASADYLKERLKRYFQERGYKKKETDRYTLTLANNGGKLPLILDVQPEELPARFQRTKVVVSADQDAIRNALDAGEVLEFARYGERGQSLRIK